MTYYRSDPRWIRLVMKERKMAFQKRFGQHFLHDNNILEKITHAMDPQKEDVLLEIGPGIGTLTERLLPFSGKYIAVEIDRKFCEILEEAFGKEEHFQLIEGDILKTDLSTIPPNAKVLGNLPYYITSAIIMHFLEGNYSWKSLTFMMQKEVAERIIAAVGTKEYGVLSVITRSLSVPEILFTISPGAFYPPPKVESALVRFMPKKTTLPEGLIPLIKASFASRRKTIHNNLKGIIEPEALSSAFEKTGISASERAERLAPEDFRRLFEAIEESRRSLGR
ncbi:MAG: 16S rRNA (adenine(1518)-N(6)/adenine(1519)-N(6))-dimethyltransferase RsmA [Bacillota bacterium]|nr:16S rRNA (adenine(1518)-N(6)/adenine(1519)-N(6))-dimethyltransferase RsmA [Bacillota bacterium]